MKANHIRRSRMLDKTITVDSKYAQEHFEELMDRVCREDIAIIVRDSKGSVVLVPCWWYHLNFNNDPRMNNNDKQFRSGTAYENTAS